MTDSIKIYDVDAFHKSGQTFLTWHVSDKRATSVYDAKYCKKNSITLKNYKKLVAQLKQGDKNGNGFKFNIYKSDSPITIDNYIQKTLIGVVTPLSAYYPYQYGYAWRGERFLKRKIFRLALPNSKILDHNSEIFVETCKKSGKAYYAVVPIINNYAVKISGSNLLSEPVNERVDKPEPVFQWRKLVGPKNPYCWNTDKGIVYYFATWVDEPFSNIPRLFMWSVAVPNHYTNNTPAVLQLALHGWGGNFDCSTYWYKVKPATIRIATVDYPVQDWWYGYRENYDISTNIAPTERVQNYTERRLLYFINWAKTQWNIDDSRIFVEGQSMGGTGAIHLGMKNGDQFAYINSWVGISSWPLSKYFRNGETKKWGETGQLKTYNNIKFDDWMNLSWWLKNNIRKETPFLSFSNGKNDSAIGWKQAVKTIEALIETKRPFTFVWGMRGHGQRAEFRMDPQHISTNLSLPAFRNCSLDNNFGTGKKLTTPKEFVNKQGKVLQDIYDGESEGQINKFLRWSVLEDNQSTYSIELKVCADSKYDKCTVDMTPRRIQKFSLTRGETLKWENIDRTGKINFQEI